MRAKHKGRSRTVKVVSSKGKKNVAIRVSCVFETSNTINLSFVKMRFVRYTHARSRTTIYNQSLSSSSPINHRQNSHRRYRLNIFRVMVLYFFCLFVVLFVVVVFVRRHCRLSSRSSAYKILGFYNYTINNISNYLA